jgi:uncharacterized protein (TIGR03437 family)
LRGVVQFALRNPPPSRFLVGALSQPPELMKGLAINIRSTAGTCGVPFELLDAVGGSGIPSGATVSRVQACDGVEAVYQVSVGGSQPFHAFLADLATAGSTLDLSAAAPATYQLTRSRLNVVLTPQATGFAADAVVNGATFTPGIAPGGVVSIFGTGLAAGSTTTAVDFDGQAATVLLASPFQVNAVVPAGLSPGNHVLTVRSAYGTARQAVMVSAVSPAIFLVGSAAAVVNPDNALNGPAAPVARGQYLVIYATGLGDVAGQGNVLTTTTQVTVVLNGTELPILYSGPAPGYPGLYQVNVVIPLGTPPNLGSSLTLKEAEQLSNVVSVAIQ